MLVFCLFFFLLTLANLGLPLSLNFVGEFLCLMGLFQYSWYFGLCSSLSVVLSAVYSLYLYNRVASGARWPPGLLLLIHIVNIRTIPTVLHTLYMHTRLSHSWYMPIP